ncbi:hypothetical protein [Thiocystis violacea]|uniref:hypothetical protein n=1 Tax=Thiocystis violacea TaxID=13725 RepID=UPI001905C091|nr:hypothetical protein [Thiocystis violacea]
MQRPVTRQFLFAVIARVSLLTVISFATITAMAESLDTPAQAMAHAIARMMESMGFNGSAGYGPSGSAPPMPADGWPSAFGALPGMSGPGGPMSPGSGGSPMSQMSQMGERLYRSLPMQGGDGSGAGPLEGLWEDNQGGVLIVQGGFYRLYSQCRGYIEGRIRVSNDQVELGNSRENITQTFDMALDQGRLVLRSPSGTVFLYRRLVLGQDR